MAVGLYRWDTAGAPQLSGTAGALIAVLDYVLVTGQGWSKVYSGTNLAVYQAPVGAGNRRLLRVDDTGTTYARIVAYESMTDVNTGTNPFPTAAQVSGGLYVNKSTAANTTANAWVCAASDRLFHFWSYIAGTTINSAGTYGQMVSFGDIKSVTAGDAYATLILGAGGSGYSGNNYPAVSPNTGVCAGHFLARTYAQTGSSIQVAKQGDMFCAAATQLGQFGYPYPSPSDGGIYLAPLRVTEPTAQCLRGTIPGVWHVAHNASNFNVLDTFTGSGVYAGRTFMFLTQYGGMLAIETSNTWDV